EKVGTQGAEPTAEQLMLRALLQERFKLTLRSESREQPIYTLARAKPNGSLGPKLVRSTVDCNVQKGCGVKIQPGALTGRGTTMVQLAASLSEAVHRTVTDQTGLSGSFDVALTWTPDQTPSAGAKATSKRSDDPSGSSIFTAVQEQLG